MGTYSKWVQASPEETVLDVAARSLQERLEPVLNYLPLAARKADDDVEYVHQVRVWSRRAVAALDLYKDLLPRRRRKWMKAQLNRIRRSANDARDDDVFALRLAGVLDQPGTALLLDKVQRHRRRSQAPIVSVYEELTAKDLLARRGAKLVKKVRLRARGQCVHFGKWAKCRFRTEVDEFLQAAAGDLHDIQVLHQFRIAGKRLRYAAELLAAAFKPTFRADVYPVIEDLQERLGEINDHATARVRLERWAEQSETDEERTCLCGMIHQEQQQLTAAHAQFFPWWNSDREGQLKDALERLVT
jgi:CHAD domain-containing protein